MGGFKNEATNIEFESGAINIIIAQLIKCSKLIKTNCVDTNSLLKNNEDKITNRLIAKYLNVGPNDFRYEPQSPENFDESTDQYIGRTDIKVISRDYFRDSQAYYIIECKRIDGTANLNKKYINEGVARFASHPAKYSSYHNENIMFGYVVQAIDISANTTKIEDLQNQILKNGAAKKFFLLCCESSNYYLYSCQYQSDEKNIELKHLFYNFSSVIQS